MTAMNDQKARFLQDRVLTATPGQRVVMLFDRLLLDLTRATMVEPVEVRQHTSHASLIIGELFGSLDLKAGGPAENLSAIYGYLLKELMDTNTAKIVSKLPAMIEQVTMLRTAFAGAVEQLDRPAAAPAASDPAPRPLVGSWVG
jgi:flagellar protein FliS